MFITAPSYGVLLLMVFIVTLVMPMPDPGEDVRVWVHATAGAANTVM
ncbi:MAG: hypothetical protein IPP33_02480 [Flavobacteriales bacterium]|nr:hypothetical protein [Flavobacteriales bacterium]